MLEKIKRLARAAKTSEPMTNNHIWFGMTEKDEKKLLFENANGNRRIVVRREAMKRRVKGEATLRIF